MKRKKKLVVTTFYANGKAVWISEFPVQLDDEQIAQKIEEIKDMGHGEVDAVTDTDGRMLRF
ncbi:hypothetical protein PMSD_09990 [Paenibacillus macquariensis subsp. defensor]|nr:hypothetical protein PMSD_09990 [Paenibacillus macquariensis subsp. defensor]